MINHSAPVPNIHANRDSRRLNRLQVTDIFDLLPQNLGRGGRSASTVSASRKGGSWRPPDTQKYVFTRDGFARFRPLFTGRQINYVENL